MNGKSDIWEKTEEFRKQYPKELGSIPIEILEVIDFRLKLDVIPFPELRRKYSVDAALAPDFKGIYVDKESHDLVDANPPWLFNRIRFSLAHELGHFVLHREFAGNLAFKTMSDFHTWSKQYGRNRYTLEQEANEFAGRLLVPIGHLTTDFDRFIEGVKSAYPTWWTNESFREKLANQLADRYGVNSQVIACRLDREELWPSS